MGLKLEPIMGNVHQKNHLRLYPTSFPVHKPGLLRVSQSFYQNLMTLPSIIRRSFEIVSTQTYNFVLHNIYLPSYNSWHICLCLTLWCSFLCFALQINSYERETCFWKLEDGKRETLCALLFEFPWGECGVSIPWPICQMLPKQWAIYLLLHLSTLLRFGW